MSTINPIPSHDSFQTTLQSGVGRNIGAGAKIGDTTGGPGHPEGFGAASGEHSSLGQPIGMTQGNIPDSLNIFSGSYIAKILGGGIVEMDIIGNVTGIKLEQMAVIPHAGTAGLLNQTHVGSPIVSKKGGRS